MQNVEGWSQLLKKLLALESDSYQVLQDETHNSKIVLQKAQSYNVATEHIIWLCNSPLSVHV